MPAKLPVDIEAKYKEEIESILMECEHVYRLTIDYELLDKKIIELLANAKLEGINELAVWNLVQSIIPSYVNYKNFKMSDKKAA